MESLQREIEGLKEEIQRLRQEVRKRDGAIASLRTDIEGLKKEIQERDDTIQDKVSGGCGVCVYCAGVVVEYVSMFVHLSVLLACRESML